jgi:hypothetical protein
VTVNTPTLPEVESLARAARDLKGLAFSITNDAWALLTYRQALVLHKKLGRWSVLSASGLVEVGETTPYQNWLRRVAMHLESTAPDVATLGASDQGVLQAVKAVALPADLAEQWSQWWPEQVELARLNTREGHLNGLALFMFDAPLPTARRALLERLLEVWRHAWALLSPANTSTRRWARKSGWLALAVLAGLMLWPVRQSVLAPAEIISLESVVVASPVDGVVKQVLVRPNQAVQAGQPLVALDDTTLRSRREVLSKSVGSAQAELLATTQKSFENLQSRGDIAPLTGRVEERRAELAFIEEQLQRSTLLAPREGIAVFGDPNDWLGRPVAAGERVMLLSDPTRLGVLMHVAVADAIAIDREQAARLFLHVAPLSPMESKVIEVGYQAVLSPDNVAAYRVRAQLTVAGDVPPEQYRIGLKGTAKLYGSRVALGYWLLRRPLSALREWTGL